LAVLHITSPLGPAASRGMAVTRGGKLFLGGISPRTTEESILDHFQRYGAVLDAVAMRGNDGKPRCFGFVTFEDPRVVNTVLRDAHHLDGHKIEVKQAVPQERAPLLPRSRPPAGTRPRLGDASGGSEDRVEGTQEDPVLHAETLEETDRSYEAEFGEPQRTGEWDEFVEEATDDLAEDWAEECAEEEQAEDEPVDAGGHKLSAKVFLGGISTRTTDNSIVEYFSRYGQVVDSVAMRDKDGTPRKFGFVTFADSEAAGKVLAQPHELDGQPIEVKAAAPPGQAPPRKERLPPRERRPAPAPKTDKVFVGGLGDCPHDRFVEYFRRYGRIVDAVVMRNRETGKSRGFGFVQYDSTEPVEWVMRQLLPHVVCGRSVEVKRSVPREQCAGGWGPQGPSSGARHRGADLPARGWPAVSSDSRATRSWPDEPRGALSNGYARGPYSAKGYGHPASYGHAAGGCSRQGYSATGYRASGYSSGTDCGVVGVPASRPYGARAGYSANGRTGSSGGYRTRPY